MPACSRSRLLSIMLEHWSTGAVIAHHIEGYRRRGFTLRTLGDCLGRLRGVHAPEPYPKC